MPKLPFTKKGHSEADGMGGNHDHRGKVCWVERPFKTLPRYSEEVTWNSQAIWNTQTIRNTESWGSMGSMGEDWWFS